MKRELHDGPIKKRKRYEYFNMLSFLLDPEAEEEQNRAVESEDSTSSDPLESVKNEPVYEPANVSPPTVNTSRFEIEADPGHTILRPPMFNERNENLEDKILDMLKEIKKDEEDEDRQFMLSLVPSFRKLQDKQKFEARIEILRVLKEITFKDDMKSN